MAAWIKINYERNDYIVDLDRISAFSCTASGRITFWLPDSSIPIIITKPANPEAYGQIFSYIQQVTANPLKATWLKISYDRSDYAIDLDRVSTFCHAPNGKITFWLPGSSIPIIINKQSDPEGYQQVMEYVQQKTGHSL